MTPKKQSCMFFFPLGRFLLLRLAVLSIEKCSFEQGLQGTSDAKTNHVRNPCLSVGHPCLIWPGSMVTLILSVYERKVGAIIRDSSEVWLVPPKTSLKRSCPTQRATLAACQACFLHCHHIPLKRMDSSKLSKSICNPVIRRTVSKKPGSDGLTIHRC